MNEIKWPINIDEIYGAYIFLLDQKLNILKKRIGIFYSKEHISFGKPIDIFYESPQYRVISAIEDRHLHFPSFIEDREEKEIVISNYHFLNKLLKCFGFPYEMNFQDCSDLKENLFNGKFAYEHCDLFGYQKRSDKIWKNGISISNHDIEELSDYDMRKYELVDKENKLAEFFPLLNEVDYRNPEAIFTPFEEEGPIRKRILTGSEEQK